MTETTPTRPFATATDSGHGGLQTFVTAGPATIVADLSAAQGGLDLGPDPHELVAAGLAACTTMTMRLYAERKGWPLEKAHTNVVHSKRIDVTPGDLFTRTITLDGPLSVEQREQLVGVADRCPVDLTLIRGSDVQTSLIESTIAEAAA